MYYIPMTMTPTDAKAIICDKKVDRACIGEIERIILREKLPPLQAQAVLTEAWTWVISQGRIADRKK